MSSSTSRPSAPEFGAAPSSGGLEAAIAEHDGAVAARGLDIWIGSEPTFTDRASLAPEWLHQALGGDKEQRAGALLRRLCVPAPGAVVLRTLGRQYRGEPLARWSLGLYARRDGTPLWSGPPDPLDERCEPCATAAPARFRELLIEGLGGYGWVARAVAASGDANLRLVARCDGTEPNADAQLDGRLDRPSVHENWVPLHGLVDELAAGGDLLVIIGRDSAGTAWVELPAFTDTARFAVFLAAAGAAARDAQLPALILRGFPPPVDREVAFTTLTPDPAVVEVNQAPASTVGAFYTQARELFAAAARTSLTPYRLQYNGAVSDSGGGGQYTLGGPTPERSPFFQAPQLLPRLIRYLNRHPALSFWFAPDYIGSSGQSPRADEGLSETFAELPVALEQLERPPVASPEVLWRTLQPFLSDSSGNPHRSELNIEKLWNPHLPGRGRLGLVELRAFRMARTAEYSAAVAVLLRALAAMLAISDPVPELIDHRSVLHDRYALPFYLRHDLREVFADLQAAGLGLGAPLIECLLQDEARIVGTGELGGCALALERALEFWPLLGDVASQEAGGSRLVDASTARLQVLLRPLSGRTEDLEGWQVAVDGFRVPLRAARDERGPARVIGLRYRSFVPHAGLHPAIGAHGPLEVVLGHPALDTALRVVVHEWRPDGAPYPGLPLDLQDAAARRAERCVVQCTDAAGVPQPREPPPAACTRYCLDLRRLPAPAGESAAVLPGTGA